VNRLKSNVKNALEPQWEARFEPRSYGFRPGRSAQDAIEAIFNLAKPQGRSKWIVDTDITSAFDHLSHDFLRTALSDFPAKQLSKQWLKAGVMDQGTLFATTSGAPQGGPSSPLLLNIAWQGLEAARGSRRYRNNILTPRSRAVVRDADDLVVCCATQPEAEQTISERNAWLADRGLTLCEAKPRIVHLTEGFDFLEFSVRLSSPPTAKAGTNLFIKPSTASVKRLRTRLGQEWRTLAGANARAVIQRLNPILIGGATYFKPGVSAKTFASLDHYLTQRAWAYTKRQHPKKSATWRFSRYFGQRNPRRSDRWVCGDTESGTYLAKFSWTRIERHVMVKGDAAPDDATLASSWQQRRQRTAQESLHPKHRWRAWSQRYRCPVCGDSLAKGENIERHHLILNKRDPTREESQNMRLVHQVCHEQIHSGTRPAASGALMRAA
jgi:RNA-directed DNA polymerase